MPCTISVESAVRRYVSFLATRTGSGVVILSWIVIALVGLSLFTHFMGQLDNVSNMTFHFRGAVAIAEAARLFPAQVSTDVVAMLVSNRDGSPVGEFGSVRNLSEEVNTFLWDVTTASNATTGELHKIARFETPFFTAVANLTAVYSGENFSVPWMFPTVCPLAYLSTDNQTALFEIRLADFVSATDPRDSSAHGWLDDSVIHFAKSYPDVNIRMTGYPEMLSTM